MDLGWGCVYEGNYGMMTNSQQLLSFWHFKCLNWGALLLGISFCRPQVCSCLLWRRDHGAVKGVCIPGVRGAYHWARGAARWQWEDRVAGMLVWVLSSRPKVLYLPILDPPSRVCDVPFSMLQDDCLTVPVCSAKIQHHCYFEILFPMWKRLELKFIHIIINI